MAFPVRKVRTTKPAEGVDLDSSHWFNSGALCGGWALSSSDPTVPVGRDFYASTAGSLTKDSDGFRFSSASGTTANVLSSSSGSDPDYHFARVWNSATGGYEFNDSSLVVRFRPDTASPADQLGILTYADNNGTNGVFIYLDTDGSVKTSVGVWSTNTVDSAAVTANETYTLVLSVGTGGAFSVYMNGKKLGSSTGTAAPTTAMALEVGRVFGGAFGDSFLGVISLAVVSNKKLNDAQGVSLSANPWQIFQPQTVFYPSDSPAPVTNSGYPVINQYYTHLLGGN